MNSSILNKGNNDDFLGSSAGKNIVFVSYGVYLFVFKTPHDDELQDLWPVVLNLIQLCEEQYHHPALPTV